MRANVTRAAEGFDRRSFTVAEILRMQDAGIITDDELWVVDAARRTTFGDRWRSIVARRPNDALTVASLPGFSARLAAI